MSESAYDKFYNKEGIETKEKTPAKENGVEVWRGINIPEQMIKDGFAALSISILNEYFLSGDTKVVIFQGMLHNLKNMGHKNEDIEEFRKAINECFRKFHKPNGFMG
jgi:hypothetical protein